MYLSMVVAFCACRYVFASLPIESHGTAAPLAGTKKVDELSKLATFVPILNTINVSSEKKSARYDGDRVLRVFAVNSKHREKIKEIERDNMGQIWTSNTTSVDIFIKQEKVQEVTDSLNNASIEYRVLIDDVQQVIDNENPLLAKNKLSAFAIRKGHRLTFERYHRMSDVYEFLDYLASARSEYVTVETIGRTSEDRPIKLIKILSGKRNAPAFWIDGGIHAREWIAVASALYIINELVENRNSLDKVLLNIDFHIVPLLNPDGYEYTHEYDRLWRKNRRPNFGEVCIGTDLNRNYGYKWGTKASEASPCDETYRGPGPFSEPETRAVKNYILPKASSFKGWISFHNYGQYILYPWGYAKKLPRDVADLDRVGRISAAAMFKNGGGWYTVGNSAALLYPTAGASDDWAKAVAKIKYSYTIELRDTGQYGFLLPPRYIRSTGKEAFAAVKAICKELYS